MCARSHGHVLECGGALPLLDNGVKHVLRSESKLPESRFKAFLCLAIAPG